MGQLQNPVEMLKNYPSVNLFLGVSVLVQSRHPIGRMLLSNRLYEQGYRKLLSHIHHPHLA